LEACFTLLPKKERKAIGKHITAYKDFFKANSRVRDCDIIRQRIEEHKAEASIMAALARKRRSELGRAVKIAGKIQKMKPLSLEVKEKALEKRTGQVVRRLTGQVKELLPVVISDSKEIELLHELRKDLKRLRYILEILPVDSKAKYGKKLAKIIGGNATTRLEELQEVLGLIHDADITLEYLRQVRGPAGIIEKENAFRDKIYRQFVGIMGS
jgi:CHAD domain-containing protein